MLDSLDIDWKIRAGETEKFKELWNDGENIEEIAKQLKRKPLEVALMVMEHAEHAQIQQRSNGILGGEVHA